MRKLLRQLAPVAMAALAPLTAVAVSTPVSSADPPNCLPDGWWNPTTNACQPFGVGTQAKFCDNGWWWNPMIDDCAPPVLPG